jgi:hypothetical protein
MLTLSQKGAIAEMAFSYHATRLGIGVLWPCAEGERYDLVLDLRPRLVRVQCKWGLLRDGVISAALKTNRRGPNGFITTSYTPNEVDAFGIYCEPLDRCFLVPITAVQARRGLHLRLAPSKNNQRAAINWAAEYDLGAIAQLEERRAGSA